MNKAYKFRIYPNETQRILFAKTFGCVRFIYNKMLGDKIKYYEKTQRKLNNTPAQYKTEFEWLKKVDKEVTFSGFTSGIKIFSYCGSSSFFTVGPIT